MHLEPDCLIYTRCYSMCSVICRLFNASLSAHIWMECERLYIALTFSIPMSPQACSTCFFLHLAEEASAFWKRSSSTLFPWLCVIFSEKGWTQLMKTQPETATTQAIDSSNTPTYMKWLCGSYDSEPEKALKLAVVLSDSQLYLETRQQRANVKGLACQCQTNVGGLNEWHLRMSECMQTLIWHLCLKNLNVVLMYV